MRIVQLLAAFVLFACGPGRTTFARHPGAAVTFDRAASDPKAVEIADRVVAASGGADKWAAVKQLRWSQQVTHDGKEVVAGEQAWDRWNGRHHGRARREGGDVVVMRHLYDDDVNQAFMDNGEKLRKLEGGAKEAISAATDRWEFDTAILFMGFLLQEPGVKLAVEGESMGDDGKPRDVLKVTFDPKDRTRTATYYVVVNRETNLIDRLEIQKRGKADNERLGYGVKTWIDAGGMKFPGSVENLGFKGEVATFKDLSIGDPDETLYVPPL